MLLMPISAESLCFALTYQRLPGSSPTRTVPRPGTIPRSASAATRSPNSSLMLARVALPSRILALTSDHPASRVLRPVPGSRHGRSVDAHTEDPDQRDCLRHVDACATQIGLARVQPVQLRSAQINVAELGSAVACSTQISSGQITARQIGVDEACLAEAAVRKMLPVQFGCSERHAGEIAAVKGDSSCSDPIEHGAGHLAADERALVEPGLDE